MYGPPIEGIKEFPMRYLLPILILFLGVLLNAEAKRKAAREWTEAERQQIEANLDRMNDSFAKMPLLQVDVHSGREFLFMAHFDDTSPGEDRLHLTVVADLHALMQSPNENFVSDYYPGIWKASADLSRQMRATANRAYEAFSRKANDWLRKHPEAAPATALKVMATGFGRGGVSMALFSQMLDARGLVTDDGKMLVPPGVLGLSGGLVYDPVYEGYRGNTAFAPTSKNINERG